jgi:poly-gamma-glutamate synthesis protein (capsule biosynthesis protein)
MGLREMLWWAYKYYGQPISQPQKAGGIREHFASHRLEGFAQAMAAENGAGPSAAFGASAYTAASGAAVGTAASEASAGTATSGASAYTAASVAAAGATAGTAASGAAAGTATAESLATAALGASSDSVLAICIAGDILPSPNMTPASTAHLFDDIQGELFSADLRYANLEAPVVASRPVSWPSEDMAEPPLMNNSPWAFERVWSGGAGVNVFSTANNHALDQGVEGLIETLRLLDSRSAAHVGTAVSEAERDKPLMTEAKGMRVAWLSWTFSLNRQKLPPGQGHLVNHLRLNLPGIDTGAIEAQIERARSEYGADFVICCLHWGLEYESFPQRHVIETAERLIRAGADVIAGNHAHVIQPAQRYAYAASDGTERSGLAAYAMGDLISDMPQVGTSALSAYLRLSVARRNGRERPVIVNAEYVPLYAYRKYDEEGLCTDYRILDFRRLLRRIEDGDLEAEPSIDAAQCDEIRRLRAVFNNVMGEDGE